MSDISKAPIKRLITNNGAVKISPDALDLICENLEEYVRDMGRDLMDTIRKDNRKVIKVDDVRHLKE